jgi:hypothetical protein
MLPSRIVVRDGPNPPPKIFSKNHNAPYSYKNLKTSFKISSYASASTNVAGRWLSIKLN